jgi:2-dehydro-3-deoxyphosphogalactonate aldolase
MIPWPKLTRNLIAILRGIKPDDAVPIALALVEAGFDAIEVPLNSPDPLDTIARLVHALPTHILLGGGTVLAPDGVIAIHRAGGRLIVAPNFNPDVVAHASRLGLVCMPGVFTPTEAFAALAAGASGLKFFPAGVLGPSGIGAMRAVLPQGVVIGAVGGISDTSFAPYAAVGVTAFGLGSSLFKPGFDAADVRRRADAAVAAYDAVFPLAQ